MQAFALAYYQQLEQLVLSLEEAGFGDARCARETLMRHVHSRSHQEAWVVEYADALTKKDDDECKELEQRAESLWPNSWVCQLVRLAYTNNQTE